MLPFITKIGEKFITDIQKKELHELEQLLKQLELAATYTRHAIALKNLLSCVDISNNNKED